MNPASADRGLSVGDLIRKLLIAWLTAACFSYLLLPSRLKSLAGLEGVSAVSLPLLAGVFVLVFVALLVPGLRRDTRRAERWVLFGAAALCGLLSAIWNPRPAYLVLWAVLLAILLVYARKGWSREGPAPLPAAAAGKRFGLLTAGAALLMFLVLAGWGVARVRGLATPTFDFGLFAQMFERMRVTGAPVTTLERDGLLSHFAVHMSPVYYLLLPFYLIWPHPEALPVLQALVMVLAVIPLWLLAKELGYSPAWRFGFCLLLLVFPAFGGGANFDIHENCFLTLFLLWLFYGVQRKSPALTAVFALLVLTVKEDAAVYVAVYGLYLLVCGLLDPKKARWQLFAGLALLAVSVGWFLGATAYLRNRGDGVMNNRFENLMWNGSDSLFSVVLCVLISPMKGLYECVDPDKLRYIFHTMLPLLGLPLLTRKYERFLLLIPFFLINLLADYTFQHSIYFQYSFGTVAFLLLLVLLNLRDLLPKLPGKPVLRASTLGLPILISAVCFGIFLGPRILRYTTRSLRYRAECAVIREKLGQIPKDATVTSSKYLTTPMYDYPVLYDWQYCSEAHVLDSEYVAVGMTAFCNWGTVPEDETDKAGREALLVFLEDHGYVCVDEYGDWLRIYRKGSEE